MYETTEDLAWLQRLLDDSYARAGTHLRDIHTAPARITAEDLVVRMTGMRVAVVATVSRDGRPFTGPVDSFFYRGRLHFGTSPQALRARHLAASPAISATYVEGEVLVVTVHGRARQLDLRGADAGFAQLTRDHYGEGWDDWEGTPPAWAIEPTRMFAADMRVHTQDEATGAGAASG